MILCIYLLFLNIYTYIYIYLYIIYIYILINKHHYYIYIYIYSSTNTIIISIYILYSYIYHYYHLRKLHPHQIITTNSHSISLNRLLIQTASSYSLLIILLIFSCYLKPSSIYKNLILLVRPTLDQYIYKYLGISE